MSGLLHRLYCSSCTLGVNDVRPGPALLDGMTLVSEWRMLAVSILAGVGKASGVSALRVDGDRRMSLAAGRLGGLRAPPSGPGVYRFHPDVGDVYRKLDFDCIGVNKGIRS